ncbi:ABC transporter ATP-binding protein/permease [Treponema sp. OMZ 857]|uniref:ABC transporter ATP-binding protein/permease n=1 Tax=Treponema sp. OMZ 857 TaxID=1643513 RepID=UPI0020A51B22|nr:ABC transporter ATP-binding protein/permease [Treponema sp. OMZ 857]UTC43685.1 ABC transporter ATP-binding protein/permease [Treponema sp. OMZ 857]
MIKKRLITFLAHSKRYVYLNVLWQWIALVSQIAAVFFIGRLLEALFKGTITSKEMMTACAVFIAALAVRAVATKCATRYAFLAGRDVKTTLRDALYAKLLKLGAAYRDSIATSEVVQLASEGIEQLEVYFGRYLPQFFYSLLAPLTLFAVLVPVSFKAAVILLACVPLIPISIVAVQKIAKRLLSKYWGAYAGLGDSFLENLQGLTTLKIYQADEVKAEEMDKEAEHFRRITMKVLSMQLNSITVMDVVAYGGAAAGIITAAYQFAAGNISLAAAFSIILLSAEFFIPLRLLGSFFHIAMNGMAASDKLFYILDLPEPAEASGSIDSAAGITVQDISFSYTEQRAILTDINLTIPHGSFIALAGESGCGKSTIAALLSGKHKNYAGRILFGADELKTIDECRIMRHIAVVKHNAYLFKGTVRDNLRIAKPDASAEEMTAALKKVNLADFLDTQKGLDTELQEGGMNFSGGQRQRLALARALLFDSPVYIFDEATSNIDIESEERILQVIHELKQTKTVLLISHRLANSVDTDCIYFMEHGRITEKGTHNELMALNGRYCALYKSQSELEQYGGTAHTQAVQEER